MTLKSLLIPSKISQRYNIEHSESTKLAIVNLVALIVLLINTLLLVLFAYNEEYTFLLMDLGLIILSSLLPFVFFIHRKFKLVKSYLSLFYPPFFLIINIIYGDLAATPYYIAMALLVIFIHDKGNSRVNYLIWVSLFFMLYLFLFKGELVTKHPIDFSNYIELVQSWVLITGYFICVILVWLVLNEKDSYQNEIKSRNAKLMLVNRDKDKFISILAHDLKSPFNSILGFLNLLSENVKNFSKEEIIKYVGIIHKSAYNSFYLLEDLLSWSQSKMGTMPFEPEKVDLAVVVDESFASLQLFAMDKKIKVVLSIPKETIVFADRNRLNTTVRNLLSNALKFTEEGGEVSVRTSVKSGKAVVIVSDTGVGIPKEIGDTLFDISVKHSSKGTNSEQGTGLGLFLCKECVNSNGGEIWFESKLGEGTSFFFSVPRPNAK